MTPDDDMARLDDRLSAGNTGLISGRSSVFTCISAFGLMQTRRADPRNWLTTQRLPSGSATAVSARRSAKSRSQRIWSAVVAGDWADRSQAAISSPSAGNEYLGIVLLFCSNIEPL